MKNLILGLALISSSYFSSALAGSITPPDASFYREFTKKIRAMGDFKVPVPGNTDFSFHYELAESQPLLPTFKDPLVSDLAAVPPVATGIYRNFWDKMLLKDGSYIQLGTEKIPLTCIFISGQDNRFLTGKGPLFPDFFLKVYLVANDYACTGPINPGWPGNGGKKELWDTYIYFEVRDPTIMLPTEIHLRYRWAEYPAFLMDNGIPSPTPAVVGGMNAK